MTKLRIHVARCAALTRRAERIEDMGRRAEILREALEEPEKAQEPNQVAIAAAGPLGVLLESGMAGSLANELERILCAIAVETHPVQRQDALYWLMYTLLNAPEPLFMKIFEAFRQACLQGVGWKTDYNLVRSVELLNERYPAEAKNLALLIWRPRIRRRMLRRIGQDENTPPEVQRSGRHGVVCPLCGLDGALTRRGAKEICGECGWIDDPAQYRDPDSSEGSNPMSLNDTRARRAMERRETI